MSNINPSPTPATTTTTTTTRFSNLSGVVHPRIQRTPAAVGIHITRQLSRKTLILEVEFSSFLNICLESLLFEIKNKVG